MDYPVTIVQTTQGLLNAAWEARLDEDGNIITGLQVTQGIRMIGRRNMNLTAIGTALAGRAYWLDAEIADNTVMGYQVTDGWCTGRLTPTRSRAFACSLAIGLPRLLQATRILNVFCATRTSAIAGRCTSSSLQRSAGASQGQPSEIEDSGGICNGHVAAGGGASRIHAIACD